MKTTVATLAALVLLTGCSATPAPTSYFSKVIEEETGNFLLGKDLLACDVYYSTGRSGCTREIELMVFSAKRIVKKFGEMTPNSEVEGLVESTIKALEPVANSGFEVACAEENQNGVVQQACIDARAKISGKGFALKNVWDTLDAWQVYF